MKRRIGPANGRQQRQLRSLLDLADELGVEHGCLLDRERLEGVGEAGLLAEIAEVSRRIRRAAKGEGA